MRNQEPGPLVIGQPLAAQRPQRVEIDPGEVGCDQDGHLAPTGILHPDHRDVFQPGEPAKRLFDFGGIDVEPTRNQHILGPVYDLQIAILIHHANVTGVEPAARQRRRRLVGAVDVAGHDRSAAHPDLAGFARLRLGAVLAHDPHIQIGHRQPGRTDPAERLVRGQDRDIRTGGFGLPISLRQMHPAFLPAPQQFHADKLSACDRAAQRRQVSLGKARVAHHHFVQHGNAFDRGNPFALDHVQHRFGGGLGQEVSGLPGLDTVAQEEHRSGGIGHRHRQQHPVIERLAHDVSLRRTGGIDRLMAHRGALWQAGGAGCIADHRDILAADRHAGIGWIVRQHLGEAGIARHRSGGHHFDPASVVANPGEQRQQDFVRDDHRQRRIRHGMVDFIGGIAHIKQHDRPTRAQCAEHRHGKGQLVVHEHPDPIAGAEPLRDQAVCKAVGLIVQFAPGQCLRVHDHRLGIAANPRPIGQVADQVVTMPDGRTASRLRLAFVLCPSHAPGHCESPRPNSARTRAVCSPSSGASGTAKSCPATRIALEVSVSARPSGSCTA